jgi:phospholipase C
MRHLSTLLLAMSLSWNLSYPSASRADDDPAAKFATNTPIKHVVVIFDENDSFDHYFGTYPNALNLPGETSKFYPAPQVNGLTSTLLTNNPNKLSGGSNIRGVLLTRGRK